MLIGCGGGGMGVPAPPFTPPDPPFVGEITGPSEINCVSEGLYNVEVVYNYTEILYSWSCEPETAGFFSTPQESSTYFQPYSTEEDVQITIAVEVAFREWPTEIKYKTISILNADVTVAAVTFGGINWDDGQDICVDNLGNIYIIGGFEDTVDFDPGANSELHTSNGSIDVYLCKYQSDGTFLWCKTWGGSGADISLDVETDNSGNIYVTGRFEDTVDFNPGTNNEEYTSHGGSDIFLSKFDSNGDLIWSHTWGGLGIWDEGHGLAIDSLDYVLVTGWFGDQVDFDPGQDEDWQISNGANDIFLSKFDSTGLLVWAHTWGGMGIWDEGHGLGTDSFDNILVTGCFEETVDFDPGQGEDWHTSNGVDDIFLSGFNPDGSFAWTRTWGGIGIWDNGFDLITDSLDNVIVTGRFTDTVDFDPSAAEEWRTSNGAADMFLSKFDSSGNLSWIQTCGGTGIWDEGHGLAVDGNDNVYLTGRFSNTVNFNPDNEFSLHTAIGGSDIFLSKYNKVGIPLWTYCWGSALWDEGNGIVVGNSEDLFVIGHFMNNIDFNPADEVDEHTSNGSADAFLMRVVY